MRIGEFIKGMTGSSVSLGAVAVSLQNVEAWLRITSLCVGIIVGIMTGISVAISIAAKIRRNNLK